MNGSSTIEVSIYTNRDEIITCFPARWVVCPDCDGRATTTRHIECDGGGFTADEFANACYDDEEFADKYFGGFYDRPCPTCDGRSTVQIINEDAVTGWRQKILLRAYHEQARDRHDIDAIQAAERRFGA